MDEQMLTEEMLEQIAGGNGQSGMPCPRCGSFIPVSMQEIQNAKSIVCPNCALRLDINRQKSNKAIEALKRVSGN